MHKNGDIFIFFENDSGHNGKRECIHHNGEKECFRH